ncbi:MAG: glycosyltransferase [Rhodocyclaceae bacterium]
MIAVIVPAHNERVHLPRTLTALLQASRHPDLKGEEVRVLVVLDACDDGSADVVAAFDVAALHTAVRNVGAARARGADRMLAEGARWLAFTDADTVVAPTWLASQLALGADAVCGSVAVEDWTPHGAQGETVRACFAHAYTDADGHRHIHGANLGVSATAYRAAGGFAPLACGEDVALVAALTQIGARIAWSAAPRVVTSARTDARARGGFGDTLLALLSPA